jgi:hypothetical protein
LGSCRIGKVGVDRFLGRGPLSLIRALLRALIRIHLKGFEPFVLGMVITFWHFFRIA